MLNYLSRSITDFLLLKETIKTEEKEIYIYGVQLIISSIIFSDLYNYKFVIW